MDSESIGLEALSILTDSSVVNEGSGVWNSSSKFLATSNHLIAANVGQQNWADVRDPVLDVVDPGKGQAGFQEERPSKLGDQAVLAAEELWSCLLKSGPKI